MLAGFALLGLLFIPTLVGEVNGFAQALPDYVDDISNRRGRLGFLEREYQVTERVREAVESGGASQVLGLTGTALAITKGIITAIVATVTIMFMTVFMLLEGPMWVERFYALLPERSRDRWRDVGQQIYGTVGGYVTGNLFISVIAGIRSGLVLWIMDVPYALALGLLVALLDLVPLVGATLEVYATDVATGERLGPALYRKTIGSDGRWGPFNADGTARYHARVGIAPAGREGVDTR